MTETRVSPKTGSLPVTLATWIFLLDQKGIRPRHPGLAATCDALAAAGHAGGQEPDWDALGQALVDVVRAELGKDGADAEAVAAFVRSIYGEPHVDSCAGSSREERLKEVRSYEFRTGLPWLAQIIDRFPDRTVGPHWVMVERVTDTVTCMDPYPWDDVDEEYQAPLVDFLVKWELAGCAAVRYTA